MSSTLVEHILAYPDDLEPQVEVLDCGATLRVWRGSKLVSAHGIRSERVAVPTGGLIFEVTFPAPRYGPAPAYISRLRADRAWDDLDFYTRYVHVTDKARALTALYAHRDRVYDLLAPLQSTTQRAWLIERAFEHHLHLDISEMDHEMLSAWEALLPFAPTY